jgi:hypothetical protein
MLVQRQLRRAGPDAEHAEPDHVALELADRFHCRALQPGWIHAGNERLTQLYACRAGHCELLGQGSTHERHDGCERSTANQLSDEGVADGAGCSEDYG